MVRVFKEIELGVFGYEASFPSSNSTAATAGFTSYANAWLETITAEKSTIQGYSATRIQNSAA